MSKKNPLLASPPYAVEKALKRLGADLRTARLRRNHTIQEIAQKIGTGRRAVADAEKGKPSTGIAVYAALLWAFDLLGPLDAVANPRNDEEGHSLALIHGRERARKGKGGMSNDF